MKTLFFYYKKGTVLQLGNKKIGSETVGLTCSKTIRSQNGESTTRRKREPLYNGLHHEAPHSKPLDQPARLQSDRARTQCFSLTNKPRLLPLPLIK